MTWKLSAAFAVWFRAIVHNCSHRIIRADRRMFTLLEDAIDLPGGKPGPDELALANDMSRRVIEAVRRLPEHERDVVRLFYFGGCSQRDIAELLGVPVTTVNNRLHSSRTRLRRQPEIMDLAPVEPQRPEEVVMRLTYETTKRQLLKGDVEVIIRPMTRDDIPAMRRLDDEIDASLDFANAQRAPGAESCAGGPWSDDQELARHFDKYEAGGNIILLAESESGKLIGFAELWAAHEPEPFGRSLDAEFLSKIARVVAFIAGEAGAKEIPVPFPCDMSVDSSQVDVTRREFAFAWMRKTLGS